MPEALFKKSKRARFTDVCTGSFFKYTKRKACETGLIRHGARGVFNAGLALPSCCRDRPHVGVPAFFCPRWDYQAPAGLKKRESRQGANVFPLRARFYLSPEKGS